LVQEIENHPNNAVDIPQYIVVPITRHRPTLPTQEPIALFIALRLSVLPAINLDDQASVDACKIDDVGRDRMLTPEVEPHLPAA